MSDNDQWIPGPNDPINQWGQPYDASNAWNKYKNPEGFLDVPSDPNPWVGAQEHPTPDGGFDARYFDPNFGQWYPGHTNPPNQRNWWETALIAGTTALAGGAIGAGALGLIGPAAGAGGAGAAGAAPAAASLGEGAGLGLGAGEAAAVTPALGGGSGLWGTLGAASPYVSGAGTGLNVLGQATDNPELQVAGKVLGLAGGAGGVAGGVAGASGNFGLQDLLQYAKTGAQGLSTANTLANLVARTVAAPATGTVPQASPTSGTGDRPPDLAPLLEQIKMLLAQGQQPPAQSAQPISGTTAQEPAPAAPAQSFDPNAQRQQLATQLKSSRADAQAAGLSGIAPGYLANLTANQAGLPEASGDVLSLIRELYPSRA